MTADEQHEPGLDQVWTQVVTHLTNQEVLTPSDRVWMRVTTLASLTESTAIVQTVSEFSEGVLNGALYAPVTDALSHILGRDIDLTVHHTPPGQRH